MLNWSDFFVSPVLLHYIFYILHKVCFRLIFIFLYIEEKSERYISLFLPKYQPLSFTTRIYLILYATQSLRFFFDKEAEEDQSNADFV
jgi:hypothetical protein